MEPVLLVEFSILVCVLVCRGEEDREEREHRVREGTAWPPCALISWGPWSPVSVAGTSQWSTFTWHSCRAGVVSSSSPHPCS